MTFIVHTLLTVVPFLIILGVLVFVHELGHYMAARRAGMRIHEFAIGFGGVIWSTKRTIPRVIGLRGEVLIDGRDPEEPQSDETVYSLRSIPLGGFVRIAGMDPGEDPNEPGGFNTKPWGWRFVTLIAGCVMNFLLAILIYASIGSIHGIATDKTTPVIQDVIGDTPAMKVGLKPGDRLLAVGGTRTSEVKRLRAMIESHAGKPVEIAVQRGAKTLNLTVTPSPSKDESGHPVGRIGIAFTPVFERMNPVEAVEFGGRQIWVQTEETVLGLGAMITGRLGFRDNIGGPVMILQRTGEQAKQGTLALVDWAAMLSINLGIFNLLPIPALDGGRLLFLLIEAVRLGRRVDPKKEAYVHMAGFVLLLLFIVTVTFNDLSRAFSHLFLKTPT